MLPGEAEIRDRSYIAPRELAEVVDVLAAKADATDIVAGGTDLMVAARIGKRPLRKHLMAIHRVESLRERTELADGSAWIGALTTHTELCHDAEVRARYSALADASALVGSHATQNVGTIGGNIANASPAMDTGSPLLCFDADVQLASVQGPHFLPLAEFVLGPGATSRRPDEVVTAFRLPVPPAGRLGSAYLRHDYRAAMEVAVVGAAALIAVDDDDDVVTDARLALTAVAPTCVRVPEAERLLLGCSLRGLPLDEVTAAVEAAARPIDDVRASASYRVAMIRVIARRVIDRAISRIPTCPPDSQRDSL